MFVWTPSMLNSASAVRALRTAARHDDPCTSTMSLANSESYWGLITNPARP